jgi:hypothetical protein
MSHQTHPIIKILIACVFLFLIGYTLFNSRHIIAGPQIQINELNLKTNTISTNSKTYTLSGTAAFASYITLNGLEIVVDEGGNFKETLVLSEQINPVKIIAKDRFAKQIKKDIVIVYTGGKAGLTNDEIISNMFKEVNKNVESVKNTSSTPLPQAIE